MLPGVSQAELDRRIHQVLSEFELVGPFFAGYPVNQDFDYSALYPLLRFAANNVGDPFGYSRYQANTHETEREVVRTVAELMRLPPDEAWGYVTAGGTEGNMSAVAILTTIPVFIITLIFQRQIVEGITSGVFK